MLTSMILVGLMVSAVVTLISYGAFIAIASFIAWMAIDAAKQDRYLWLIVILGAPVIGSVAYYYTEKKHQYAKAPSHHIHDSETESQHEVSPHTLAHKEEEK